MAGDILHVSDLDDTLLGDPEALERFAACVRRNRPRLRLAYASGRFYESVCASLRATALPEPAAVLGGVGTEIRYHPAGEIDGTWRDVLSRNWDAQRVCTVLAGVPRAIQQPADCQSELKRSYYLHDATAAELSGITARLRDAGLGAQLVYSSRRDLDVIPAAAGKGAAARYLAQHWRIPPERVVVSGDSGNDRSLFENGFRGIVVANACPELKALRGPRVYQAQAAYAAGVLEGLEHWLRGAPGWT